MIFMQIDPATGLVYEPEGVFDGWLSVKVFREAYKKNGIKYITAIALTADYLSPINYYNNEDRPIRAVEIAYEKRHAIKSDTKMFKECIEMYMEFQKDTDLEMRKVNDAIKIRLLEKLSKANQDDDYVEVEKISKNLSAHETRIKQFNEKFNIHDAIGKAVASNGYELSRIEAEIVSRKNSKFVNHGEGATNPDKLNLKSKS